MSMLVCLLTHPRCRGCARARGSRAATSLHHMQKPVQLPSHAQLTRSVVGVHMDRQVGEPLPQRAHLAGRQWGKGRAGMHGLGTPVASATHGRGAREVGSRQKAMCTFMSRGNWLASS